MATMDPAPPLICDRVRRGASRAAPWRQRSILARLAWSHKLLSLGLDADPRYFRDRSRTSR